MNYISVLINLIVLCIVGGLIYYLLSLLPLPDPFKRIILIAFILIAILVLLGWLFGGLNMPIVVAHLMTLPVPA